MYLLKDLTTYLHILMYLLKDLTTIRMITFCSIFTYMFYMISFKRIAYVDEFHIYFVRNCIIFFSDHIVGRRAKCVRLSVRCRSFSSWLDLLEECVSGVMTELFKPLELELRKLKGMENVELYVEIMEHDFMTCVVNVGKYII